MIGKNAILPHRLSIHLTDENVTTPRPPLPPQEVTKYQQSIQFPKCVTKPFQRIGVLIQDAGLFRASPLKTHVVVCGFPRSGSTLLQLMIEACVSDVQTYGRERRGMEAAKCYRRVRPIMMTKRPSDIFTLDDLRDFYSRHHAKVKFVLMTRDPRAVLTSIHHSNPGEYYVPAERWRAIDSYWLWATSADDVVSVRYEDLICKPDRIQQLLTDFVGWNVHHPFADFHNAIPEGFDTRALNGVRKLDPTNTERWRKPEHRTRLTSLLTAELQELPTRLQELGYEQDDGWVGDYAEPKLTRVAA